MFIPTPGPVPTPNPVRGLIPAAVAIRIIRSEKDKKRKASR